MKHPYRRAFTLIELLIVIAILMLLAAILFPVFGRVRENARRASCQSNMKQIGLGARQYMQDYDGNMFHAHEKWMLDDGSQADKLPADASDCDGGGALGIQAPRPWIILFQPYLKSREVGFCPSDPTPRSTKLATNMMDYDGNAQTVYAAAGSEVQLVEAGNLTSESYLLNDIWTRKICYYAKAGLLNGFATDATISQLPNSSPSALIMFSERNSEGFSILGSAFYSPSQDDYDAWRGEAGLVRSSQGKRADEGEIRYNRHLGGANYLFADGHVKWLRWSQARGMQYPDGIVKPGWQLLNPPA